MNRRTFLSCSARFLAVAHLTPRMFAENPMLENNRRRALSFSNSNEWIESTLVSAVHEMPVEDAIVVNLSTKALHYRAAGNRGTIPPWKSTILRQCTLENAELGHTLRGRTHGSRIHS